MVLLVVSEPVKINSSVPSDLTEIRSANDFWAKTIAPASAFAGVESKILIWSPSSTAIFPFSIAIFVGVMMFTFGVSACTDLNNNAVGVMNAKTTKTIVKRP